MTLEWGPDEGKMTWDDAVKLAAAKGDGWRLPTVAELVSQYDYEADRPKDAGWRGCYWSSSPVGGDYAWAVVFDNGFVDSTSRDYEDGVRCVREAGSILTDRPIDESRARYAAELREALDELAFIKAEYGDGDPAEMTKDALLLKVKTITLDYNKARAEVERLMITNNDCNRAIDWAKNEMNKLRDVIRQVHALAAIEEQDYRCVRVVENLREIRKLTKEEP